MGKTLKKIADIIQIGAFVVGVVMTGGALAAGLASGTLKAAFGAVVKNTLIKTAFTVAALAGSASQLLNKPKLDLGVVTRERTELNLNPVPDRKWVFGYTAAAMDMLYAEVFGTNKEFYTVVIAHAGHLITTYERLWIDGELVTFSGNNATGRWAGLLTRQQRLGTVPQTAMSINSGSRWTATETATGIAVQALAFTADQEKNPRGLPTRIVQEVTGSPVYDPRLDTTVGGSGSHRADDQTTWEYSNSGTDIGRNAALVYLTYLLGWLDSIDVVLGVGIPADDILYDTFIEAANVCEANDWFFDGVLSDGDGHKRNLRAILTSFAGEPLEIGGKFGVRAPFDDTASVALAITGDRIMGQVHREGSPEFSERVNIARGRYIEPANAYQPEEYPPVELADLLAIDGSELPATLDFFGTQDSATAQQLAGVMLREMRQPRVRLTIDQTGLAVQPGEIISVTLAEIGFSTTKIRVKTHEFSFDNMTVDIEGRIVQSSDYDLVTPGAAADSLTPSLSKFDELVSRVTLTGLSAVAATINTLYGTVTSTERFGFGISWDNPGVQVLETQIQYKPTAESNWINAPAAIGDTNGVPNTAIIPGIEPDTDYDIRARHVNLAGFPGDWDTVQVSSTVRTLNTPANLALVESLQLGSDGSYRTVLTVAFDPPADDLHVVSYEAQYSFVPRHGLNNWQPLFDSLRTNWEFEVSGIGQYQVRVRTIYIPDILFSDWAEVSATTLGTYSAISAIGLSAPEEPRLYITLNKGNNRADIRISVKYDKTADPIEPGHFVMFYSVDDIPNELDIVSDAGSQLRIGPVNLEGVFDKTVAAGSTLKEVKFNGAGLDVDLSGMWWFRIQSGVNGNSRYYKVVRADSTTLAINPAESLAFLPQAGDTVRLIEVSYHDSRIAEFRFGYVYDPDNKNQAGEVVQITGVDYNAAGNYYFVDVAQRAAEGTTQVSAAGKKLAYYPAYGIDTKILTVPVEDFSIVGDTIEYSNNVAIDLPAEFSWFALSCCFVQRATQASGVKWERSYIVPLAYSGKA